MGEVNKYLLHFFLIYLLESPSEIVGHGISETLSSKFCRWQAPRPSASSARYILHVRTPNLMLRPWFECNIFKGI